MNNNKILFCYILIFARSYNKINSEEIQKLKASSESFSKNLNLSNVKNKSNKSKDDSITVQKKNDNNVSAKNNINNIKSKNNSKNKDDSEYSDPFGNMNANLFESKESKSKNISKTTSKNNKKNNKADAQNNDPFGDLDTDLFSPKKTKVKSDEKQKNIENKKELKKKGEEKQSKKKEETGFFSNLWSNVKSGGSAFIKSDIGKQIGGITKDAVIGVTSNAIKVGNEKLQNNINSIHNKQENVSEEKENVMKEQIIDSVEDGAKEDINYNQNFETNNLKEEIKKEDTDQLPISEKLSQSGLSQLETSNNVINFSDNKSQGNVGGGSKNSGKNNKRKVKRKAKIK